MVALPSLDSYRDRLRYYADRWRVLIDETSLETASSVTAFGTRGDDRVALKIVKNPGDEWRAGEVIRAFRGRGMVRVLESEDGAVLLERATPGTSLADAIGSWGDDHATSIIGGIMRAFSPGEPPSGTPTAESWGLAFRSYRASGDQQVPGHLVAEAQLRYDELCASQRDRRLLHGDLQHSNILFDQTRGWIAIDPKGVIGEPEFEVGPFLRNPPGAVHHFDNLAAVERRLRGICTEAGLAYDRALHWAFALAVLSAIWCVEDVGVVHADNPALTLAGTLHPAIDHAS
jgi:streptomycin 6-kinase